MDLYRFLAIPQRCGGVRVIALQPRFSRDPVETLTAAQFVERSRANGLKWREGGGGTLVTVTDIFGATIIGTRLQQRRLLSVAGI